MSPCWKPLYAVFTPYYKIIRKWLFCSDSQAQRNWWRLNTDVYRVLLLKKCMFVSVGYVRACSVCMHVCVVLDAQRSEEDDKCPPPFLCLTLLELGWWQASPSDPPSSALPQGWAYWHTLPHQSSLINSVLTWHLNLNLHTYLKCSCLLSHLPRPQDSFWKEKCSKSSLWLSHNIWMC